MRVITEVQLVKPQGGQSGHSYLYKGKNLTCFRDEPTCFHWERSLGIAPAPGTSSLLANHRYHTGNHFHFLYKALHFTEDVIHCSPWKQTNRYEKQFTVAAPVADNWHIKSETKLPLFCRWHFQIDFLVWKLLCFHSNFTEICSQGTN